jgi:hypothetical protein
VPAILAGAGGAQVEPVTIGGIALVTLVVTGLLVTIGWWVRRPDRSGAFET